MKGPRLLEEGNEGDGPTDPTPAEPPTISDLRATPTQIEFWASTALSWTTTDAVTCSITGGVERVPCTGSVDVSPDAPATYSLRATAPMGSHQAGASVSFLPPSLTALTPYEGLPGEPLQLTPTGAGFASGETQVPVVGGRVAASDLAVNGAGSLGVTRTLAADSTPEERNLRVATPSRSCRCLIRRCTRSNPRPASRAAS